MEEKIYTLAYADDMVLIAEEEDELKSMIERLEEEYLEQKGETRIKCKEDEDSEVQERRKRKMEEKGIEMERGKDEGSEKIYVFKI